MIATSNPISCRFTVYISYHFYVIKYYQQTKQPFIEKRNAKRKKKDIKFILINHTTACRHAFA